ncbi:metalloprotease secretion chaperone CpaB [Lysobacter antibioticus]|uniref:metalloprotease secretion chaperone CpaB n=1 Tax=Lysobacter antibioticus TaxID=84531 RepID=UPI00126A5498|nr:metalloprotease secretion chaperone CpaB [Lysobacter antibioticus]
MKKRDHSVELTLVLISISIAWALLHHNPLPRFTYSASRDKLLNTATPTTGSPSPNILASSSLHAFATRRRATFLLDETHLKAARLRTDILQLADPKAVIAGKLKLTEEQINDGRQFVVYDLYVLESKDVGDAITVYLPSTGLALRGAIDSVEVNGDIIRWSGTFEDFNSTQNGFSISQTMIDDYVLGNFETPIGSFNLEAKNGLGWIVDQAKDFHLPDDGFDYVDTAGLASTAQSY